MFWCCVTSNVIYTLITHAQEPIKLLHSYGLLYKQSSFTVQNMRTPLAKIGHVIFRYLATQHVFRALLIIMHVFRALFKFQNGNRGSELRSYIKSVRYLKFLFCLRIHALAKRTMNSKWIMNSASPRSLLNFLFIVRLARACVRKQNTHLYLTRK